MDNKVWQFIKNSITANPIILWTTVITSGICAFAIVIVATIGLSAPKQNSNLPDTSTYQAYDTPYLTLISYSPTNEVKDAKQIKFYFNHPVDTHDFEHALQIFPKVKGVVTKGDRIGNEIIFTPEKPFQPGSRVSFTLTQGMKSTNGYTLLSDVNGAFQLTIPDTSVAFVKNNIIGRVLSTSKAKGSEITIKKGNDLDKVTLNIYRSTKENLLRFLTYDPPGEYVDRFGWNVYGSSAYLTNEIQHSEDQKISQLTISTPENNVMVSSTTGIYYLEAKSFENKTLSSSFVLVTESGLTLRQDDQKIIMSAYNNDTGKQLDTPLNITFYNLAKIPNILSRGDLLGVRSYNFPLTPQVDLILAEKNSETILVPLRIPLSQADIAYGQQNLTQATKMVLYTDKPIYKPGDTIRYKGIIRYDEDALYRTAEGKRIKVWFGDYRSTTIEKIHTSSSDGTFYGEVNIPDSTNPGNYLYATTTRPGSNEWENWYVTPPSFEIANFIKPEFDINVQTSQTQIIGKEDLKFKIIGKYFDGRPLKDQEIPYTLYGKEFFTAEKKVYSENFNITSPGGMCGGGGFDEWYGETLYEGSAKLNANGEAEITIDRSNLTRNINEELTLIASLTDNAKNELEGSAVIKKYAADASLFFLPTQNNTVANTTSTNKVYAENLNGEKLSNKEIEYSITTYTDRERPPLAQGKVRTDSNGIATFTYTPDKENTNYYLNIKYTDDKNNTIQTAKYIYTYDRFDSNTDSAPIRMTSLQNSYLIDENLQFEFESEKEIDALLTFERGRIYEQRNIKINKGKTELSIPVTDQLSPSITAVISYFKDGDYFSQGMSLNTPAMHKLLNVQITPDKTKYLPDEDMNLTLKVTDQKGNPRQAKFSLSVVDKAIFAINKNAATPLHSLLYYFRPRTTSASSSLTPIGIFQYGNGRGGGGGGDNIATKTVDTLYWNPELETNTNGEYTTTLNLKGYSTTWKIQAHALTNTTMIGQGSAEILATRQ